MMRQSLDSGLRAERCTAATPYGGGDIEAVADDLYVHIQGDVACVEGRGDSLIEAEQSARCG
jgi:hypothetical protein